MYYFITRMQHIPVDGKHITTTSLCALYRWVHIDMSIERAWINRLTNMTDSLCTTLRQTDRQIGLHALSRSLHNLPRSCILRLNAAITDHESVVRQGAGRRPYTTGSTGMIRCATQPPRRRKRLASRGAMVVQSTRVDRADITSTTNDLEAACTARQTDGTYQIRSTDSTSESGGKVPLAYVHTCSWSVARSRGPSSNGSSFSAETAGSIRRLDCRPTRRHDTDGCCCWDQSVRATVVTPSSMTTPLLLLLLLLKQLRGIFGTMSLSLTDACPVARTWSRLPISACFTQPTRQIVSQTVAGVSGVLSGQRARPLRRGGVSCTSACIVDTLRSVVRLFILYTYICFPRCCSILIPTTNGL